MSAQQGKNKILTEWGAFDDSLNYDNSYYTDAYLPKHVLSCNNDDEESLVSAISNYEIPIPSQLLRAKVAPRVSVTAKTYRVPNSLSYDEQ